MLWKNIFYGLSGRHERAAPQPLADPFDLERPLLQISKDDFLCVKHCIEGIFIVGQTGSGKSSGPIFQLGKSYFSNNFGGVIFTVKDEVSMWQQIARKTGRTDDLIIFNAHGPWRFNFLDYQNRSGGRGAGFTQNVVSLFNDIIEIAERGQSNVNSDPYWARSQRQLIANAVDLCKIAKGRLSVPDLYRIIISAPQNILQVTDVNWQRQSFLFECLIEADEKEKNSIEENDLAVAADYFLNEFANLSDKTRSCVVSCFTSAADILRRGVLRDIFCSDLNLMPDLAFDGRIIICDIPTKIFLKVGEVAQSIFKYCFQQACEQRDVSKNNRPVFIFLDEAQNLVSSYDRIFQSTCRSARVCSVFATQNLANFYSSLGGEQKGKVEAQALLSNLNTKFFLLNSDTTTNNFAADLCARNWSYRYSFNSSGTDRRSSQGSGFAQSLDHEVLPREFTLLRSGGPEHDFNVDAICHSSGRTFRATDRSFLKVIFKQEKL